MRLFNRLLAALISVALVVIGVLVVVEVIADRLGKAPAIVHWHQAYNWAHRTPWQQGSVRVACIALAVIGLILLLAELKRSRPSRLRTTSTDVDSAYSRRGVAGAVRSAVARVDGINHADVTVKRRRVKVAATTAGLQPFTAESLREPVSTAAQQRLDTLELDPAPSLSVRVSTRSR